MHCSLVLLQSQIDFTSAAWFICAKVCGVVGASLHAHTGALTCCSGADPEVHGRPLDLGGGAIEGLAGVAQHQAAVVGAGTAGALVSKGAAGDGAGATGLYCRRITGTVQRGGEGAEGQVHSRMSFSTKVTCASVFEPQSLWQAVKDPEGAAVVGTDCHWLPLAQPTQQSDLTLS
jgi:hypothetical protein